jgi:hypothetical protein
LDWTEFAQVTPVPDASSASGRYGTGNSLEKIANTADTVTLAYFQ